MGPFRLFATLLINVGFARLNGPSSAGTPTNSTMENTSIASTATSTVRGLSSRIWQCEVIRQGELRNWAAQIDPVMVEDGPSRSWMERKVGATSFCLAAVSGDGRGNVRTTLCDGSMSQAWAQCADGSIRNLGSEWCLTRDSKELTANGYPAFNVFTSQCPINSPTTLQKWVLQNEVVERDNIVGWPSSSQFSGLEQTVFQLKPLSSEGECLTAGTESRPLQWDCSLAHSSWHDGNVCTHPRWCQEGSRWYFNNRGRVINTGRLVNQGTGACLRSTGPTGRPSNSVIPTSCTWEPNRIWTLYESGELIDNGQHDMQRCMRPSIDGTGNIGVPSGCRNTLEWRWEEAAPAADTFLIQNKRSRQCLGDQRRRGRARTVFCADQADLRFKWESTGFTDPVGEWIEVGCSENSQLEETLVSRITSSQSLTETTTITVKASIEKGVVFGGASLETSVSQSLALSWASSRAEEQRLTTGCRFWPDGTEVRGPNCLWRWRQTMENPSNDETITWSAVYARCTTARAQVPLCSPYRPCANKECTECLPYGTDPSIPVV